MAEIYTNDHNLKPSLHYDAATNLYKIYFEGVYDSVGIYLTPDELSSLLKQIQKSQKENKLPKVV